MPARKRKTKAKKWNRRSGDESRLILVHRLPGQNLGYLVHRQGQDYSHYILKQTDGSTKRIIGPAPYTARLGARGLAFGAGGCDSEAEMEWLIKEVSGH